MNRTEYATHTKFAWVFRCWYYHCYRCSHSSFFQLRFYICTPESRILLLLLFFSFYYYYYYSFSDRSKFYCPFYIILFIVLFTLAPSIWLYFNDVRAENVLWMCCQTVASICDCEKNHRKCEKERELLLVAQPLDFTLSKKNPIQQKSALN